MGKYHLWSSILPRELKCDWKSVCASKWNCLPNLVISFRDVHKIVATFLYVCVVRSRFIALSAVVASLFSSAVMCAHKTFSIFQVSPNLISLDKNPKPRISWLHQSAREKHWIGERGRERERVRWVVGWCLLDSLWNIRRSCDYSFHSNCEKCWWQQIRKNRVRERERIV